TLVGLLSGMDGVNQNSVDVITTLGGGKVDLLWRLRMRNALPSLFSALKIGGPTALLATIIGEFIAGGEGLGVALLVAQQQGMLPRVWALTFAVAIISILLYAVLAVIERLAVP